MIVGLFGTAVFYGDGVITPAISVLVGGRGPGGRGAARCSTGVDPGHAARADRLLFAVQRFGTGGIGKAFGPVTLVWFVVLVALGLPHIAGAARACCGARTRCTPSASSPSTGWSPSSRWARWCWCVTGGEALYADMGHFGKRPIRIAWYGLVMPALVINYFGQGALLLRNPSAVDNPFYLMAPSWALLPLVVLATAATVIASQALISAAFSVTKQAIQLGLLPRMRDPSTPRCATPGRSTCPSSTGACTSSSCWRWCCSSRRADLASAYGIAVTLDMTITTVMTFFVIRYGWRYPLCAVRCWPPASSSSSTSRSSPSNMLKLLSRRLVPARHRHRHVHADADLEAGPQCCRASGCATTPSTLQGLPRRRVHQPAAARATAPRCSCVAEPGSTPNALMHNLKHNKVLHEQNLFVTVKHHDVPWIGFDRRVERRAAGPRLLAGDAALRLQERPRRARGAAAAGRPRHRRCDDMDTSYFLSRDIVMPDARQRAWRMWREKLFASMHRNAAAAADFLNLPTNRVVELGAKVEI